MKLSQPPSPSQAKKRLLKAIQKNELVEDLLYELVKGASVTIGPVTIQIWPSFNDNLKQYSEVWLTLSSPEGREWIKNQLDYLFDYIEYLIGYEESKK